MTTTRRRLGRSRAACTLAVGSLTAALLLPTAGVAASEPRTDGVATAADAVVVASGLQNPRGLAVHPNGTVYVATAGTGGTEPIDGPPLFGPSLRGNTGSVLEIGRDGTVRSVVSGLPSFALGGFEVVGPAALAVRGRSLWLATAFAHAAIEHRPGEAAVLRIDRRTGETRIVSDVAAYERANDPDGFGVESDLNGITFGRGNDLWVSDAGGNTVYRIDSRSGTILQAVVLPGLPGPFANPARGGANELDPVPTGVAPARDGGVFVSLLSGFPFPTGAAKVLHVSRTGEVTDVARGLTALTDVEVGPDGALYAVQLTSGIGDTGIVPNSGRVLRLRSSGSHEAVVDELDQPFAVAFDKRGAMYITERANELPSAAGSGRVLRLAPAAYGR